MNKKNERLVLDANDPSDRNIISAGMYGFRVLSLIGFNDQDRLIAENLVKRCEAAKYRTAPFLELTPVEARIMAEAVTRQMELEIEDLVFEKGNHPDGPACKTIADFATSQVAVMV
ncbi:MAG TPA: hypothetical protein VFN31_00640 [Candidatus Saccharimonadales bacterium]|nr:hypothetical protein [Candidatus Saccharimonadales bacterium]